MAKGKISSSLTMGDLEKRLRSATPDVNDPRGKFGVHNLLTRRMVCMTVTDPG